MKDANLRFIKIEIIEIIQFNLWNFFRKLNYEEVGVDDWILNNLKLLLLFWDFFYMGNKRGDKKKLGFNLFFCFFFLLGFVWSFHECMNMIDEDEEEEEKEKILGGNGIL